MNESSLDHHIQKSTFEKTRELLKDIKSFSTLSLEREHSVHGLFSKACRTVCLLVWQAWGGMQGIHSRKR